MKNEEQVELDRVDNPSDTTASAFVEKIMGSLAEAQKQTGLPAIEVQAVNEKGDVMGLTIIPTRVMEAMLETALKADPNEVDNISPIMH